MVRKPKDVVVYPKRDLGSKSVNYLRELKDCYKCGKVSSFTYERLIRQYYSNYTFRGVEGFF